MKIKFTLSVFILFITHVGAQIYTPNGTIQGVSTGNNVGIGTNAPSQKLDVIGVTKTIGLNSITVTGRPFVFGASAAAQNYGLFLKNDGSSLVYIGDSNGSAMGGGTVNDFAIVNPNYGGHISLFTTGIGNVGIGTTTPGQKLDVIGITKTIGLSSLTATGRPFVFGASAAAQNYGLFLKNDGNPLVYIGDSNGSAADGGTVNDFAIVNPNSGGHLSFITTDTGNVGIGTINPTSKLTVKGDINSREVKVTVDAGADFVFANDYNLPSLEAVDKFIQENKHLPEIASADEMKKKGINLSEMNIKLLQKIEELTLYVIEQNENIKELKSENQNFKSIFERFSKNEEKLRTIISEQNKRLEKLEKK